MDFDLANLDKRPTSTIGEVITRLADAADVYSIDPARRFGVFRSNAREFHMLERATTFADKGRICDILQSWAASSRDVAVYNWRAQFDVTPLSYARASAALNRALQLQDIARRFAVAEALPRYRAAGRAVVIGKLKRAVDAAKDPFAQLDLMVAARHAEALFDCDPLVLAGEAVLAGKNPSSLPELRLEHFDRSLRILTELRRIRRDVDTK